MLYVIGGTTFDLFAHGLPALPAANPSGDEFSQTSLVHLPRPFVASVGGNAGNAAYVLARLNRTVKLVTCLGSDLMGRWLLGKLEDAGVDVLLLPPSETSINVVATDVDERRQSLFRPVQLSEPEAISRARATAFEPHDVLLIAGYPQPTLAAIAAWSETAHGFGALVALDVGPAVSELSAKQLDGALKSVDVVLANRLELGIFMPDPDPASAARELASSFGLAVVVKDGANGVTFVNDRLHLHVPAHPISEPGPTVGAGDSFNAGFLSAYRPGDDPTTALRWGTALAAIVIEGGKGVLGISHLPDLEAAVLHYSERQTNDAPSDRTDSSMTPNQGE